MSWIQNLIREDLRALKTYSSARTEAGAFVPDIGLDANEFPWPPFGFAATVNANRYPEPQPKALVGRLATLWNVAPASLLVCRGSDEGIDVLIRLFCQAGRDTILICPPTYGMYAVSAAVQGCATLEVPLRADDKQLDVDKIVETCSDETKLIFIPSPNAPMGHPMQREALLDLCRARTEKSLIVVDEAYVEFSATPEGMIPELASIPNLIILRTLSKAYALAGERIGCVLGAPEIIQNLRAVLAPYPLTQTSIRAALDALSPNGLAHNAAYRKIIEAERAHMAERLLESPLITKVFPSKANFLLTQTTDAQAVMETLRRNGILVRDRSRDLPDTIRFSIGTPEENNLVLTALGIDTTFDPAPRIASVQRTTKETSIAVTVDLDHADTLAVATGLGFFDHMLEQIGTHGGFGLTVEGQGDLYVDPHHLIEDTALALGDALHQALGDKKGIGRYGFTAPLDEALATIAVDLSGRPYLAFEGSFDAPMIGSMPSSMVEHFFRSLSTSLGAAIHLTLRGTDDHHKSEAAFKALGRALRQAFCREDDRLPSTKGVLA